MPRTSIVKIRQLIAELTIEADVQRSNAESIHKLLEQKLTIAPLFEQHLRNRAAKHTGRHLGITYAVDQLCQALPVGPGEATPTK